MFYSVKVCGNDEAVLLMTRLFVYGTLKRRFPNYERYLSKGVFVAEVHTRARWPLVVTGPWRVPVLLDCEDEGCQVRGELFEVDDSIMSGLDELEDVGRPDGYYRRTVELIVQDKTRSIVEAVVYVKQAHWIEESKGTYMAEYHMDSEYVERSKR